MKGQLVGELDPPRDFGEWLRGEIDQCQQVKTDPRSAPSVHARRAVLQEAQAVWNDSRRQS